MSAGWNDDDVERWLNDYPLPKDFTFNGAVAWPRYELKKGYGFWLRTAGSYHEALRGLFRLICQIIQGLPAGAELPSPEKLAALLRSYETVQEDLALDVPPVPPEQRLNNTLEAAWPQSTTTTQ